MCVYKKRAPVRKEKIGWIYKNWHSWRKRPHGEFRGCVEDLQGRGNEGIIVSYMSWEFIKTFEQQPNRSTNWNPEIIMVKGSEVNTKYAGCGWMRPLMILQQPLVLWSSLGPGCGSVADRALHTGFIKDAQQKWRQVEACWSSSSYRPLIIQGSWEEESCPSDEQNRNTLFTVYHFGQLFLLNVSIIALYMSEMQLDPFFPPPVTTSDIWSRGSEPDALMQRWTHSLCISAFLPQHLPHPNSSRHLCTSSLHLPFKIKYRCNKCCAITFRQHASRYFC